MKRVVTVHQPVYAPYLGVVSKIDRSDVYVVLNDVEFSKSGFIHRNKFVINGKVRWVSLPVRYENSRSKINEVRVATEDRLYKKGLNQIRESYRKSPYFNEVFALLEGVYKKFEGKEVYLDEFNLELMKAVLGYLGVEVEIVKSSDIDIDFENPTEMNMKYVEDQGGEVYLSGKNGKEYMQDEIVREYEGIKVVYQDFEPRPYKQFQLEEFEGYLSVFDYMFNHGREIQPVREMDKTEI